MSDIHKNRFVDTLKNYGQQEFAELFLRMDKTDRDAILKQAELFDLSMLRGATKEYRERPRGVISPIETMTMNQQVPFTAEYRRIGLEAIRAGKVGAVMLAGGMGTRLGYDHAKGMCDIGLTQPVYIFQRAIENLLEVVRDADAWIHLYIMTSYGNDAETRDFFKEHEYFGYAPEYITFFVQDMAPCLDEEGHILLEARDRIAMSPNGNGGFYSSLMSCGLALKARQSGIEFLNVFAVDNVLQRIADPVFVGAVIKSGASSGAKVVVKAAPDERVGAICLEDGAPSVVEYYDMTPELMAQKAANGAPAYNYGVILNYLFRMRDIDRIVREELPIHLVKRKIPYFDPKTEETIKPESPNGYKLETLVLDMVHLTGSCLSFEVERSREFAPIKNATGVDSVESAREMLKAAGIRL